VEEDAGVGEGGAAGCVGGYGAQSGERLRSAADEEQRANAGLGGDGAAGKDAKAGSGGEGGGGDQANIGGSAGQASGAFGGGHSVDLIAEGERGAEGGVLEVPHEGSGVEKVDGGYAKTGIRGGAHIS